jgi:hypothetical protein
VSSCNNEISLALSPAESKKQAKATCQFRVTLQFVFVQSAVMFKHEDSRYLAGRLVSHEASEPPEGTALTLDLVGRGIVGSARFLVLGGGLEFDVLRAACFATY